MSIFAQLRVANDDGERRVRIRIVNKTGGVRMVQLQEPLRVGDYILAAESEWLVDQPEGSAAR
jgi:hypothetical protein